LNLNNSLFLYRHHSKPHLRQLSFPGCMASSAAKRNDQLGEPNLYYLLHTQLRQQDRYFHSRGNLEHIPQDLQQQDMTFLIQTRRESTC
jgi:hypothetical protein